MTSKEIKTNKLLPVQRLFSTPTLSLSSSSSASSSSHPPSTELTSNNNNISNNNTITNNNNISNNNIITNNNTISNNNTITNNIVQIFANTTYQALFNFSGNPYACQLVFNSTGNSVSYSLGPTLNNFIITISNIPIFINTKNQTWYTDPTGNPILNIIFSFNSSYNILTEYSLGSTFIY